MDASLFYSTLWQENIEKNQRDRAQKDQQKADKDSPGKRVIQPVDAQLLIGLFSFAFFDHGAAVFVFRLLATEEWLGNRKK